MKIHLREGLPLTSVTLVYQGKLLELKKVLIDTGSAGTVFPVDKVVIIGIIPEPQDPIRQIRGVGGFDFVFVRRLDRLLMGELKAKNFEIEIGAMNCGFDIQGIVGMDFLTQTKALIDLRNKLETSGTNYFLSLVRIAKRTAPDVMIILPSSQ